MLRVCQTPSLSNGLCITLRPTQRPLVRWHGCKADGNRLSGPIQSPQWSLT